MLLSAFETIKYDPIAPIRMPNPTPIAKIENLCQPAYSGFLRVAKYTIPNNTIAAKPHVSIFTSEKLLTHPFYRIDEKLQVLSRCA